MALKGGTSTRPSSTNSDSGSFANPIMVHRQWVLKYHDKYKIPAAVVFGVLEVEGGTDDRGRPVAPGDGAGPPSFGQFTFGTGKALGVQYGNSQSEVDAIYRYLLQLGYKVSQSADSPANKRAIGGYNGGPGNPQLDYAEKVLAAAKKYGNVPLGGGGGFPDIPNPLDPIKDGWNAIKSLIQLILSPEAFAKLWARVFAFFFKMVWKAFFDIVIAPPWHWTQRAVNYYFNNIMSAKAGTGFYYKSAGIVTILFWSIGYGILWGKAEQGVGLAQNARESMLGRSIKSGQNVFANRKVTKPKDVEAKTSTKPEAVTSQAAVSLMRSISVSRRRPVTVRQNGGTEDGTTDSQAANDSTT